MDTGCGKRTSVMELFFRGPRGKDKLLWTELGENNLGKNQGTAEGAHPTSAGTGEGHNN